MRNVNFQFCNVYLKSMFIIKKHCFIVCGKNTFWIQIFITMSNKKSPAKYRCVILCKTKVCELFCEKIFKKHRYRKVSAIKKFLSMNWGFDALNYYYLIHNDSFFCWYYQFGILVWSSRLKIYILALIQGFIFIIYHLTTIIYFEY